MSFEQKIVILEMAMTLGGIIGFILVIYLSKRK